MSNTTMENQEISVGGGKRTGYGIATAGESSEEKAAAKKMPSFSIKSLLETNVSNESKKSITPDANDSLKVPFLIERLKQSKCSSRELEMALGLLASTMHQPASATSNANFLQTSTALQATASHLNQDQADNTANSWELQSTLHQTLLLLLKKGDVDGFKESNDEVELKNSTGLSLPVLGLTKQMLYDAKNMNNQMSIIADSSDQEFDDGDNDELGYANSCYSTNPNNQMSSEEMKMMKRKKKTRTVFSRSQVHQLETTFDMKRYLSSSERVSLAHTLQLSETQVKIWFQNRRNKWKRQLAAEMENSNGNEELMSPIEATESRPTNRNPSNEDKFSVMPKELFNNHSASDQSFMNALASMAKMNSGICSNASNMFEESMNLTKFSDNLFPPMHAGQKTMPLLFPMRVPPEGLDLKKTGNNQVEKEFQDEDHGSTGSQVSCTKLNFTEEKPPIKNILEAGSPADSGKMKFSRQTLSGYV